MTVSAPPPSSATASPNDKERTILCDLLLDVAGRDMNRLSSARRHHRTLRAALHFMNAVQASVAEERLRHLETKWGPQFPNCEDPAENGEIQPLELALKWATQRRFPEGYLRRMHHAARAVLAGQTSLSMIEDAAYRGDRDARLPTVSFTTFGEWLLQTRVAVRHPDQGYVPGSFCQWWANEMDPTVGNHNAYGACLKRLGHRARRKFD